MLPRKYSWFLIIASLILAHCGADQQDRLSMTGVAGVEVANPEWQNSAIPLSALDLDSFDSQEETQQDKDAAKQAPSNFIFSSPVKAPFNISYFYGPRILGSLGLSLDLENNKKQIPTALKPTGNGALAFLTEHWQFHTGIDYGITQGTAVYAVADGEIFGSGFLDCPGQILIVKHVVPQTGQTIFALYEHLSAAQKGLKVGDQVKAGDKLGSSGHSGSKMTFSGGTKEGCVEGDNLHFELRALNANPSKDIPKDISGRWSYIYTETAKINPADYIQTVEEKCQSRRTVELNNAQTLEKTQPGSIPPYSAGRCSQKFEAQISALPKIFQLQEYNQTLLLPKL